NISLDGSELQSGVLEIGAFSGSECRGSVILQNYPENPSHPYLGFLTVYGNGGEEITFKVYNHDTGKEYTAANEPVIFATNDIYGNPDAPYTVNITDIVTQQTQIYAGWTWVSSNVKNDETSLLGQFKQNIGESGVMLKSRNAFIQNPGWIGTLQEINNREMYMVNNTTTQILPFTGFPVEPNEIPITLFNGWNWIGYTPQTSLPVGEALANLNPQQGDQIKSYWAYSEYTAASGWIGSLQTMNPGEGYMYYSTGTKTLFYPVAANSSSLPSPRYSQATVTPKWSVDEHKFANNMTVTHVVLKSAEELQSDQIEIGAFAGDECRGTAFLQNVQQIAAHPYMGFLVVYGDSGENIKLRIYDHASGREYDAESSLSFTADAIHGSPANPYPIVANTTAIDLLQTDIYVTLSGDILEIHNAGNSINSLEINDLSGRKLIVCNVNRVNVSELPSGVYILKIHTGKGIETRKLLKP
ncbi:MAG: T9SS type A sorting domain-containing protein, partial [Dysgonamonadaceae bacterium]|nr:T9SS type A sorting domain-containing protein [Dysgonamonadaceae bacterium]